MSSSTSNPNFLLGLVMLIAGMYWFLSSIQVSNFFGMSYGIFSIGRFRVTSGMVLIPFVLGMGMIFFNTKNTWGWLLLLGSMIMLFVGIILNLQIYMRTVSALEILLMLTLIAGGAGLMLRGSR